jgi:hypothetical protein
MFKDFHRRLQRDLKKIVDARVRSSNARISGDAKVQSFLFVIAPLFTNHTKNFIIVLSHI